MALIPQHFFDFGQFYRRTAQIRIRPATADPMPTSRRMLSGVASALFMARRIQAGLAANSRPSSTNRMPTPMRKSANAMDLIGSKPPLEVLLRLEGAKRGSALPCLVLRLRCRWRGSSSRRGRLAGRVAEELEEV